MLSGLSLVRGYFDERLIEISETEDDKARYRLEVELLSAASIAEFAYRSGFLRGKIISLGLESYLQKIVDGMNAGFVDLKLLFQHPSQFFNTNSGSIPSSCIS